MSKNIEFVEMGKLVKGADDIYDVSVRGYNRAYIDFDLDTISFLNEEGEVVDICRLEHLFARLYSVEFGL